MDSPAAGASITDGVATVRVPMENVNDESVTLLHWSVPDRGYVNEGQLLASLETSKAVVELPAPVAGYIHHAARAGDDVVVGGILCHILPTADAMVPDATAEPVVSTEAPGMRLSELAEQPVASPVHWQPATESGSASPSSGTELTSTPIAQTISDQPPRFSRKAQALVEEHRIPPEAFRGRRIVREQEALLWLRRRAAEPAPTTDEIAAASPDEPPSDGKITAPGPRETVARDHLIQGATRAERVSRRKRTEIKTLADGVASTLSSTIVVACPTRGLKAAAESAGAVPGALGPLVVFEAARLLLKYPMFNAYYQDDTVYYYNSVHIGYAMSGGSGLRVPVIHNAEQKSISQISLEIREHLVSYLDGALSTDAMSGGTFTITDLSSEDVLAFMPLISRGQSAILGVGGEFFASDSQEGLFTLSLAFDHQVGEGRDAARFLGELKERLAGYEQALIVDPRSDGESDGAERRAGMAKLPSCTLCFNTFEEVQSLHGHLLQAASASGDSRWICTICLSGL